MKSRFIVEQKITAFANQYRVFAAGDDGMKGELLAFAQQKRLAFREKVTFYADEKKSREVFGFRAEKVMDIHGRFFVEDPAGKRIGAFKKDFKKSLLSSTWHILDSKDETKFTLAESNATLAAIRRYAGYLPIIGDIIDLIIAFFRYHFTIVDAKSGQLVGKYQKTKLFRDHYMLIMNDATFKQNDWRVLAAVAVALDALQGR